MTSINSGKVSTTRNSKKSYSSEHQDPKHKISNGSSSSSGDTVKVSKKSKSYSSEHQDPNHKISNASSGDTVKVSKKSKSYSYEHQDPNHKISNPTSDDNGSKSYSYENQDPNHKISNPTTDTKSTSKETSHAATKVSKLEQKYLAWNAYDKIMSGLLFTLGSASPTDQTVDNETDSSETSEADPPAKSTTPGLNSDGSVTYTHKDPDSCLLSIDEALKWSEDTMKFMDTNNDKKVSFDESGQLGQMISQNGETNTIQDNLALTVYEDLNQDGTVTQAEMDMALEALISDPEMAKTQLQKFITNTNLDQKAKSLGMEYTA